MALVFYPAAAVAYSLQPQCGALLEMQTTHNHLSIANLLDNSQELFEIRCCTGFAHGSFIHQYFHSLFLYLDMGTLRALALTFFIIAFKKCPLW